MKRVIPAIEQIAKKHNITSIREMITTARKGGFVGRGKAIRQMLAGEAPSVIARGKGEQTIVDFIAAFGKAHTAVQKPKEQKSQPSLSWGALTEEEAGVTVQPIAMIQERDLITERMQWFDGDRVSIGVKKNGSNGGVVVIINPRGK